MNRNLILLYGSLLLVPVIINYGLLTWTAPGVSINPNPWLGFLGSFLGIIGAITIAVVNSNNQTKKDNQKERRDHRSFIQLHDFQGSIGLKSIKTHENSRLIETDAYLELKNHIMEGEHEYTSTAYLKIVQHGNSEVILNCAIRISRETENGEELPDIVVNTGVVEREIELFIPIVYSGVSEERVIKLKKAVIEYSTLMNERMKHVTDFENSKERLSIVDCDDNEDVLFEFNLQGARWSYPNKEKSG